MGFFDKLFKAVDLINETREQIEKAEKSQKVAGNNNAVESQQTNKLEDIVILSSYHTVEEEEFAEDDSVYAVSFKINDSFKEANSHAGEVIMLNTYAPNEEYGDEGEKPYVAIQVDDSVYEPVEEFKKTGTFKGAIEITPLSGKFYFKAKKEYYGDIMYFYGFDRCDGFYENNGLCMVYPKAYVGTENEVKLMGVLDEVAESYNERRIK